MLRYKTAKACMQTTVGAKSQCQFELGGNRSLNLQQLPRGNQKIKHEGQEYFVSVCKPVIYTPTSACPPDTHVCVYDATKKLWVGGFCFAVDGDLFVCLPHKIERGTYANSEDSP